jgi:hypothetical protein
MKRLGKDRRTSWLQIGAIALVAVILGGATVMSRIFFERPRGDLPAGLPSVAPRTPLAEPTQFRVSALAGSVEAFQNGQWYVARAGHLLSSKDVVRTHDGSRALLRRGSVEIELRDNMDLRLDKLENRKASLGLLRGDRVSANVGKEDEHLEIKAMDTRTENVGAASFTVAVAPSGQVSVATTEGAARFESQGKHVLVRKGMESSAAPGLAPGTPEPIPEQLLLSVIWPEEETSDGIAKIKGHASPSSRIWVNRQEVPVGPDGNFQAPVPSAGTKTPIRVDAEDISGRKKSESRVMRRTPSSPHLEASGDELWNK